MVLVQSRVFHRTIDGIPTADEVNTLIDGVQSQANVFMATLAPDHVLDYHSHFAQAGKYGPLTHYQITIVYLTS